MCLALVLAATACAERKGVRRVGADAPDILLITVDTLRADHLGCYGYPRETSPALDALADSSVQFDNAYVQIPKTTPSIASLMTGLYPQSHKNLHLRMRLPDVHLTLAEALQEVGYRTGAIIGQYNLHRTVGMAQGFDTYSDEFSNLEPSLHEGGTFDPFSEKRAATLVDEALSWLDEARVRPRFLWVHFMDPHAAYDPPPPHDEAFDAAGYEPGELAADRIHKQAFTPGHTDLPFYLRRYDGEIRYLDQQIGRLLDGVRAQGRFESSMIVFTTDHGEYIGDPDGLDVQYFSHGSTLSEGETRAPLLWKLPAGWSNGAPPRHEPSVVELVDVMPTLLDLLDLEPIDGDGRSLRAALEGDGGADPGAAYSYSFESNYVSLQTADWKLLYFPDGSLADYFVRRRDLASVSAGGRTELYRRATLERVDDPETTERLRQRLVDRLALTEQGGSFPVNESIDDPALIKRLKSLGYL